MKKPLSARQAVMLAACALLALAVLLRPAAAPGVRPNAAAAQPRSNIRAQTGGSTSTPRTRPRWSSCRA